jgi:hypothetical protein
MRDEPFPRIIPTLIQIRAQAHDRMLKSLSPDNRRLLSQVIGQLAVTTTPDVGAAARELDGALTPEEKHYVEQASAELEEQALKAIEALKQNVLANARPGEQHVFSTPATPMMTFPSPGMTLLAVSIEELITQLNRAKYGRPPE